jgi:hypothetical protein
MTGMSMRNLPASQLRRDVPLGSAPSAIAPTGEARLRPTRIAANLFDLACMFQFILNI